jgi:NAD-dependent dihydropyrimidine dehydrogenase PreA subunit/flavodoxin
MIFYFSGAGNSYAVAKQIAERLDGETVVPLAGFKDFSKSANSERIGFAFPCYCGKAPRIVLDFKNELFQHIDRNGKYVYAVITFMHSPAGSYLDFKEEVDAWFKVKMPQSDIYNSNALKPEKAKALLAKSRITIDSFAKDILSKKPTVMYHNVPGMRFISNQANNFFMYKDFDKKLYADEKCTKCKQCTRLCPVQNISFNGCPVWGERCVSCFSCINRCPQSAIQAGDKTHSKRRYVHPDYKRIYYAPGIEPTKNPTL